VWRIALQSVRPLGTGPATFISTFAKDRSPEFAAARPGYLQTHAHNSVLEAASTMGALGVLSLVAFLVAPHMAGLWTVAMFNPISFEVVFIACVLVGLSWPRRRTA
jgi:O-antigen ligase